MGPASDYDPFKLNDDRTRGGFARLAWLIAQRKAARGNEGPVLVLDAGDYSMGTAFGAATGETGCELQLMSHMGYDATTFGNHDFDFGPAGLAKSIDVAVKAGRFSPVVASNTNFAGTDPTLADLQRLARDGVIRRHLVIDRGGIRFGIFGVLGKEAQFYTTGAEAVTFADANETAKEMATTLRENEKADVVICLSHGGVEKGPDGRFIEGDDVRVAEAAPGIDVVIGGHSHTELSEAIIVNGRTPVVQTGMEGRNLGELVITLDGRKLTVVSYRLYPIDDTIAGDRAVNHEIENLKKTVTAVVLCAPRLQHRSAASHSATRYPQHIHRHRRQYTPRQSHHGRFQKGHGRGYRIHCQWVDARWLHARKVRRANRLRCVFRGPPRGRGRRSDRR
jgi:5'-nucleotidase